MYLLNLEGITIKLQSTSLDIVHAFRLVEGVKDVYQSLRKQLPMTSPRSMIKLSEWLAKWMCSLQNHELQDR